MLINRKYTLLTKYIINCKIRSSILSLHKTGAIKKAQDQISILRLFVDGINYFLNISLKNFCRSSHDALSAAAL